MLIKNLNRPRAPWRSPWIRQSRFLWWLEIKTAKPYCTYYFGPFANSLEARRHMSGYVEDLVAEQAEGITIKLKQCQPKELTFSSDSELD